MTALVSNGRWTSPAGLAAEQLRRPRRCSSTTSGGFTTSEFYRDGFQRQPRLYERPDSATIERVEILKGPASSLTGAAIPAAR
ncbi:TonB-dependent receptor plug domain-containing protein [Pseudomonas aeruginosa]